MSRRKKPAAIGADEHIAALGELLEQLKSHLTQTAGQKGTYGDYLRLLEFYREAQGPGVSRILAGWVDSETQDLDAV